MDQLSILPSRTLATGKELQKNAKEDNVVNTERDAKTKNANLNSYVAP